jgi:hypothetical protein
MSFRWFTRLLLVTLAGLLGPSAAALADPPVSVARVSFIGGLVSFRPASLDEWSLASLNYPLTIGDHVWTDRGARTELQLGSTVVRIAPYTEFSVLDLDGRTAQLRVTQGTVSVRVRDFSDPDVLEIDTPNGAVSLLTPGLYRIDVSESRDSSTVTVRQGAADVVAADSAFRVLGEQSLVLTGVDAPQSELRAGVRIDEFEDWSLARDRRADNAQAVRYVSPDTIGYEDLDANGTWQTVGGYGTVWVPRVRAEWVPYRYGRWAWVDPWGWTWIDDAPWGFAPFHYGRWAFVPTRGWAWVPGTIVQRPVYAPALVAFVGDSDWNLSLRLGPAPISWFPLGPREVFVPAYRASPEYLQRVNVPHVTNVNVTNINITNINVTNATYVNREVPGAVTAVSRDTFVRARPVAAAAVAIPREQVRAASIVMAAAPVVPERASIAGQPKTPPPTPPASAVARQVVVRRTPPPLSVPFAARQAALAQHPGQPVDESTENALRSRAPQANVHPLVRILVAAKAPAPAPPVATPAAAPNAPANAQTAVPRLSSKPAVARPPSPAAVPLGVRQSQERAEIDARHAQERTALQARHQQELQQAADAKLRADLQHQHQQEMKTLQDRQKEEKAALQKRQQEESKKKEPDQK